MSWIKMLKSLPTKPEVMVLQAEGFTEDQVIAGLFRLWCWADDNMDAEGVAQVATLPVIDVITKLEGFGSALVRVGWLAESDSGVLFVNHDRHMSSAARNRALAAERSRRYRTGVTQPSRSPSRTTVDTTVNQQTDRQTDRQTDNTPHSPPKGGKRADPFGKDSDDTMPELDEFVVLSQHHEFRLAWNTWRQHRREIRKKLTPTSVARTLAEINRNGAQWGIEAINHTVRNGWQGLKHPGGSHGSNGQRPQEHRPTDRPGSLREL